MQKTYTSGGINWQWYLTVEFADEYAPKDLIIVKHWRMHKFHGPEHPQTCGSYRIIEDSERIACAVTLEDHTDGVHSKTYAVANREHVFSYDDEM